MNKMIVIVSLIIALILFGYYEMTGDGVVLAPLLLGYWSVYQRWCY